MTRELSSVFLCVLKPQIFHIDDKNGSDQDLDPNTFSSLVLWGGGQDLKDKGGTWPLQRMSWSWSRDPSSICMGSKITSYTSVLDWGLCQPNSPVKYMYV